MTLMNADVPARLVSILSARIGVIRGYLYVDTAIR
jgi:hypothetical protein